MRREGGVFEVPVGASLADFQVEAKYACAHVTSHAVGPCLLVERLGEAGGRVAVTEQDGH